MSVGSLLFPFLAAKCCVQHLQKKRLSYRAMQTELQISFYLIKIFTKLLPQPINSKPVERTVFKSALSHMRTSGRNLSLY